VLVGFVGDEYGVAGCSSSGRGEDEISAWLEERSRGRFEGEVQALAWFQDCRGVSRRNTNILQMVKIQHCAFSIRVEMCLELEFNP